MQHLGLRSSVSLFFLVRLASDFEAEIRVEGVDAKSLLGLGLVRGRTARIGAEGPDAPAAVSALVALVESGFGEL